MMTNNGAIENLPPQSPLTPVKLTSQDTFQFRCHQDIACFNQCCKHIDLTLTPYDIWRLQKRLGLSSADFLAQHTVPFELDAQEMPGIKLKTRGNTTECPFLTEAGCGVYADRPTSCRYYALGLMSMKAKDAKTDEDLYFVVKEDHCLGHYEAQEQTIGEYVKAQGLEEYNGADRAWRQVVLKKRSSGPTIGKPSTRSYQLFFLASYNLDGFREFVSTEGFNDVYELEEDIQQSLQNDDMYLMQFAFRLLKQVLYGEMTIPLRADAEERRIQRRRELAALKGEPEFEDRGYDEPIEW